MHITQYSHPTQATPAVIWAMWRDVPRWPVWDHGIEKIELDGAFVEGSRGRITPKGASALPFKIVQVTEQKSFSDETTLPCARLIFTHTIEETQAGCVLHYRVEVKGLLAPLFYLIFRDMRTELPKSVRALIAHAEAA